MLPNMRLHLFTLLAALSPYVLADVSFTTPAAGAQIPVGLLSVVWADSGVAPALSTLSTYTLSLMIGGNDAATMSALTDIAAGAFTTGSTASATIPPTLAGSTANGYFLRMISTSTEGGNVINYSNRFTITGMTGTTPAAGVAAVTALNGATAGPATVNSVSNNADAAAGTTAVADAGVYATPYNLQSGLTKYAPMQPVPPTKITAKNVTPLFPTSAVTVATTWLPLPSIVTTMTLSQTFSVSSMENTVSVLIWYCEVLHMLTCVQASPVAHPNADMAKFLRRWQD